MIEEKIYLRLELMKISMIFIIIISFIILNLKLKLIYFELDES